MDTDGALYKKAFENYIRRGIPIALSLKEAHSTSHYIWRTRQDAKVRSSHAANAGKIFAWDNPPETGYPGEDYGCRCRAEPFEPGIPEHLEIRLSNVNDTGAEWSSSDFVEHYWKGGGKGVTLRETGHLVKVVNSYMAEVAEDLKGQIADVARENADRSFHDDFRNTYEMEFIVFSLGRTTIGGDFYGTSHVEQGVVFISGVFEFFQRDEFADPINIGVELPGGTPYPISDEWNGIMHGQVLKDRSKSTYILKKKN